MAAPAGTIYVVDDDDAMQRSLRWLAESAGWAVRTFGNAESFLETSPAPGPACLVLDVRLPGMGGLELQRVLAARGRTLPTIVISADADPRAQAEALRQGAVAFLRKPFHDADLLRSIEQALGSARPAGSTLIEADEVRRRLSRLTPREREVLGLLVAGRTSREIADELGVLHKTITLYRSRLHKMLGVRDVEGLTRLLTELSRQDNP